MANVIKKDGGQQAQGNQPQGQQSQPARELARRDPFAFSRDPFQMMLRDPFQMMREMMADPWRVFQMSPWLGRGDVGWSPGFDVRETDDALIFQADLPGIRNEDLDISLAGNQLVVSGKREQEQEQGEGRYHTYERSYGSFTRSFTLPEYADLDKIRCDLKDGELTLFVPKKPGSTPQRRKIQIGSGSRS